MNAHFHAPEAFEVPLIPAPSSPKVAMIVRCIRRDVGTSQDELNSGALYCERVAASVARNPWAEASMSSDYAEAGRILRAQAAAERGQL